MTHRLPVDCIISHTLQALFRVVFANKFVQLQASVASSNQLQPLLSTLLAVYNGPHAGPLLPIVIELCLTLPVQLQHLLPVIPQIMPLLLAALKVGSTTNTTPSCGVTWHT